MARKSRKNIEATSGLNNTNPNYQVGAYVRLSKEDKKHKGDSIETQQAIIGAYIDEKPDLELTDTYIDNGMTGLNTDRPAFQRMLGDLENGKINCCITKDLSRLGRNSIDTGFYIEKYFPTRGVRYIAINDNYDSANGESGGIMVSIKNLVNEAYALDIGRKVRATKQMNIRNGCFVGRLAPYGYLKSPNNKYLLVPDPETAPIVRRMFEMAAENASIGAIQEWLNNSEILPPLKHLASIGIATEKESPISNHWSKKSIYKILRNRMYVGDMVQGKYKTNQNVQVKLPASEHIITANTHEPIVSRAMFDSINSLALKTINLDKKEPIALKTENIFQRKIYCGHCGYALSRVRRRQDDYYFRCETRNTYAKNDCVPVRIDEDKLKKAILTMLYEKTEDIANKKPLSTPQKAVDGNVELNHMQSELERNKQFLKGLYENLVNGTITNNDYLDLKIGYDERIAKFTEDIRSKREKNRLQTLESEKWQKLLDNMQLNNKSTDLSSDLLAMYIERIYVFEDNRIEVRLKSSNETFILGGHDNG